MGVFLAAVLIPWKALLWVVCFTLLLGFGLILDDLLKNRRS
jgi:hypothetical protein